MSGEVLLERVMIPLIATFIGAYLAFRYQYKIEKRRDKRNVVQILMVYRNVAANELEWIKAMNLIDTVFHDDERVRQLYYKYLEFTVPPKNATFEYVGIYYEMLYEMIKSSGYGQLSKSDVERFYAPMALNMHYVEQKPVRNIGFTRYRLTFRRHKVKQRPER